MPVEREIYGFGRKPPGRRRPSIGVGAAVVNSYTSSRIGPGLLGCGNDALGDAFGKTGHGRLFTVHEEDAALHRTASRKSNARVGAVGMAGIFIQHDDAVPPP